MLNRMFQNLQGISRQTIQKVLFTLAVLVVFRIGCRIPVPFMDATVMQSLFEEQSLFAFINLASGGAMAQCAFFALGVSPFINASIIIQLLSVAIPTLGRMVKEDPDPQRVHAITKYVACGLSLFMATGFYALLRNSGALAYTSGVSGILSAITIVALLMTGSMLCTWLGEQIDMFGTGNAGTGAGVSLIIFVGIITRWTSIIDIWAAGIIYFHQHMWFRLAVVLLLPVIMLVLVFFATRINGAEMHVPVLYSKNARRGSSFATQSSYIPLKLVMGGVMPVIFAGTLIGLPSTIAMFVSVEKHPNLYAALTFFQRNGVAYLILYVLLILVFNYIYIAMQLDVVKMANTLRTNGGAIPGIRPGRSTEVFLMQMAKSMAFCGAVMLAIIAAVPVLLGNIAGIPAQIGGTSLLIMVNVALEQVKAFKSMDVHRHVGFLGRKEVK